MHVIIRNESFNQIFCILEIPLTIQILFVRVMSTPSLNKMFMPSRGDTGSISSSITFIRESVDAIGTRLCVIEDKQLHHRNFVHIANAINAIAVSHWLCCEESPF